MYYLQQKLVGKLQNSNNFSFWQMIYNYTNVNLNGLCYEAIESVIHHLREHKYSKHVLFGMAVMPFLCKGVWGVAFYSTIFKLAVLDYFARIKLAFVVTKLPQKVWVKGTTNQSLFVYIAARFENLQTLYTLCSFYILIPFILL